MTMPLPRFQPRSCQVGKAERGVVAGHRSLEPHVPVGAISPVDDFVSCMMYKYYGADP